MKNSLRMKLTPSRITLPITAAALVLGLFSCQTNAVDEVQPTLNIGEQSPLLTAESTLELPPFRAELPAGNWYTVVGILPGEQLPVFDNPAGLGMETGIIPAYASGIKPLGDIQVYESSSWVQIQFQDQLGWVEADHLAEQYGTLPDEIVKNGQQVLNLLMTKNYTDLENLIHPDLCLRFSPYSYLNSDNMIFCPPDLIQAAEQEDLLLWGYYDGTGDPITLDFSSYIQRFVNDQDYSFSPIIGFNVEVSSGNSINNIQEIYPDGMMIEYYFPGFDPQYGGMDWRSLRLVFIQKGSTWYIAAIIHSEWTI